MTPSHTVDEAPLKRTHEPIVWSLFGAGGVLSAMFGPMLILVTTILVPLGMEVLLRRTGPMAVTSANRTGRPPATSAPACLRPPRPLKNTNPIPRFPDTAHGLALGLHGKKVNRPHPAEAFVFR